MGNLEKSEEAKNLQVIAETIEYTVSRPYTEEDIVAFAAKYGGRRNIHEIEIFTDDHFQFCYLVKKPSRAVLQAVAAEGNKKEKSDITTIQKLLLGCILAGDAEAYEFDGSIYTELVKNIGGLAKLARGSLKKN